MSNAKKTGKPSMVGNMSKPTMASDPIDQLVYGTAEPKTLEEAKPTVTRIVFTNQLRPPIYKLVKQYEYWGRKAIHEILDEALTAYFADKPDALQELPEKERSKLLRKIQL
jgi:hypothetical protein